MSVDTLIAITIQGLMNSALLQHRFSNAVPSAGETPREAAEACAYREPDGLWIPGASINSMLREAGATAAIVQEDRIPLFNIELGDARERLQTFEVDSRSVIIPKTNVRVMRHRPRLDRWSADFILLVNETVLVAAEVKLLLTKGGRRIGIGDFRPGRGGTFGRFMIRSWQIAQ